MRIEQNNKVAYYNESETEITFSNNNLSLRLHKNGSLWIRKMNGNIAGRELYRSNGIKIRALKKLTKVIQSLESAANVANLAFEALPKQITTECGHILTYEYR